MGAHVFTVRFLPSAEMLLGVTRKGPWVGSWGVYPRLQEDRSGRAGTKGEEGLKKKVLVWGGWGVHVIYPNSHRKTSTLASQPISV